MQSFWGWVFVVFMGWVAYRFWRASNPPPRDSKPVSSSAQRAKAKGGSKTDAGGVPIWLREHWQLIDQLGDKAVESGYIPQWYIEPATPRQLQRLRDDGVAVDKKIQKGQASDLIGLFEEPDDDDMTVLRFFKQAAGVRSSTHARVLVSKLFLKQENRDRWAARPATVLQKEFYRFAGEKPPKGVTFNQAADYIRAKVSEMDQDTADQWGAFESAYEDFHDPENRRYSDVKKPSMTDFKKAFSAVVDAGGDPHLVDASDIEEKLLEINPALEKG